MPIRAASRRRTRSATGEPAVAALAIVAATVLAAATVRGQDTGGDHAMQRILQHATPGPQHERLEPMVGRWDQVVRMWTEPGAEPVTSHGSVAYRWILGGRFLEGTYEAETMGRPYAGRDLTGYDNTRGEYVTVWIDSMTTSFMISRGRYDAGMEALVMEGTTDDPATGRRDQPFRTITKLLDDETLVYRMYTIAPDGTETKVLEVESRRIRREGPTEPGPP